MVRPNGVGPMNKMARVVILMVTAVVCADASAQSPALMLFGGSDHRTFLGCLNCSKFSSDSVCNEFGQKGSEFSSNSIWNEFGHFGSSFSSESPWNAFASGGPVIVDRDGRFYGRFTANKYIADRTRIQALNQLAELVADGANLIKARDRFCEAQ
jgi:hypothetical protein